MTYFYIILASSFTALSNLFIRKSVEAAQDQKGDPFLIQRLLASGLFIVGISFIYEGRFAFDFPAALLGCLGGLLLGSLMWATGQAIYRGPSGLTFAIVNSACVFPPLAMALLFGSPYGHDYKWPQALGAVLVLLGIFFMSRQDDQPGRVQSNWLGWAFLAFGLHAVFLSFFQWRALLLDPLSPLGLLVPFHLNNEKGHCFTLAMFLTAASLQFLRKDAFYFGKTNSFTRQKLLLWGGLGGLINGFASFCTIKATEAASNYQEKSLIFPLFCVGLISLCNLWGRCLYHERIHWSGTLLCFAGILVALLS